MQLSLFENAVDFLEKGIEEFVTAEQNGKTRELKYSILNIAQGIELVLKQILKEIHPLFIQTDIDSNKNDHTVSVEKAIARINKLYKNRVKITEEQQKTLKNIRDKRNELTHYEVNLNVHQVTSIIAQTLPVLDSLLSNFLSKTLREELSDEIWEAFVQIERVHTEYYNELKSKHDFIEYGGNRLACGECQMRTISEVDGDLCCVYCDFSFGSIEEAIRRMKSNTLKADVIQAYIVQMELYSCHCDDCFNQTVIYSDLDGAPVCLYCDYFPYFDLVYCENCCEDSGIVEDHYDSDAVLTERAICMRCKEKLTMESCDRCGNKEYHLHIADSSNFKNPTTRKTVTVDHKLCGYCFHMYNKVMKE